MRMEDGTMYHNTIRNFVVIAHIDHGKSTLADRFLELTHAVEARRMKPQLLDQMDLERERGITIKMQPVRMKWGGYVLNLIDTPGHIDFSYEVSRALAAVEGAILLVDATQGVQAQTITNLHIAQKEGLIIIPAVNKIDAADARVEEAVHELCDLLGCKEVHVACVSAKTGSGVLELLERVVTEVPPPRSSAGETALSKSFRALIFDSQFESHRGVIAHARIFDGELKKGNRVFLHASGSSFEVKEVGIFTPSLVSVETLQAGEIGYVITGIKNPLHIRIGDTMVSMENRLPSLLGYKRPQPVIWASFYPEEERDYETLRDALGRLQLNDAALQFEPESSPVLGRSFACGFLGMLHLEIVTERLKREYGLSVVTTSPSIAYEVMKKNGTNEIVLSAAKFPPIGEIVRVREPWVTTEILAPDRYLGDMLALIDAYEGVVLSTEPLGGGTFYQQDTVRMKLISEMPLREMVSDFFDKLKSVSAGYASLAYESAGLRDADVERIDIHVAGEPVLALSRVVSRAEAPAIARSLVRRLKDVLPRQQFLVKIQAVVGGKIIASESLAALRKDVTGYLYGGDRTRKMKLWKKQKAGKKRLKAEGRVHIPPEVYLSVLKK